MEALGKDVQSDGDSKKWIALLSRETTGLIEDQFKCVPLGSFELKGIQTKTEVYRLVE